MFSNRLLRESAKVGERSLSSRNVPSLTAESAKVVARYTERLLAALAARGPAASVDIQDMYFRLTMDIFTFIAFGVDLDSLEREEARARALARAQR